MVDLLNEGDRSLTAEELSGMRISSLLLYASEHNISLDSLEDQLDNANDSYRNHHLEIMENEIDRMKENGTNYDKDGIYDDD